MKLSIVIPAFNEELYLRDCLHSISLQIKNRDNVEVIVVNNASTDKTGFVARSFEFVKLVNETKKGIVYARKAGLANATGDLIANIDADTRLTPGWIETVLNEFENNKKLVALSGPFIYSELTDLKKQFVRVYYNLAIFSNFIHQKILHNGAVLQGGNYIVRKDAMNKIGGFNDDIIFYGEDTDVAKRISKIGYVKFTNKLPIFTSARRLQNQGIINSAAYYIINFFSTIVINRPITEKYEDYR